MISYRVIPVLLLKNGGLVKTVNFKKPKYIGDPINAVKIFNDKEVDELIFLDIDASKNKKTPDFSILKNIASECFIPLGYGGGITNIQHVETVLSAGFEKVIFNSSAISNPELLSHSAKVAGNQSVVSIIDVKKNWRGERKIYSHSGLKIPYSNIVDFAKYMQEIGVGEIIINSVDNDGKMGGYDIELIHSVSDALTIPVVACGGAGKIQDLIDAVQLGNASAVAAASIFVFHGPHKAVLINYPNQTQLKTIFK